MRDPSEILRGPFDIETHKGAFVHYLEVCIDRDGVIRYAVPSHQRWLLERFMDREGFEADLEAWGASLPTASLSGFAASLDASPFGKVGWSESPTQSSALH